MIQNSILFFILGYITAHAVRVFLPHKKDPIVDAVAEFKALDKKERGTFITINKAELKMKESKDNLSIDDVLEEL